MQRVDELVLLFLNSTDQGEASRLLDRIVAEHARPLLNQIIRAKLRLSADGSDNNRAWQDADDIVGDVVLQLVRRMLDMKSDPRKQPVSDLTNYVAAAGHNAFNTYLRRKHPERWRLKDKLRYVLTYQRGFSLWEGERGRWLCGFEVWREQSTSRSAESRVRHLRDNKDERERICLDLENQKKSLPGLVVAVFNWAGGPLEFDDLVAVAADLLSIGHEARPAFGRFGEPRLPNEMPDQTASLAIRLEQRVYLESLWLEIRKLPLGQRRALLLNLRDSRGHDMTAMFAHTHIATLDEVAEALEMSLKEFFELSHELPMEDSVIAKYLGMTRQQVINLRTAARRRLARRMRRLEGEVEGSFR